jgi:type III restriction enzyme
LLNSGRLEDVFKNPEEFISGVVAIIKEQKMRMEVETVKYLKSGDKYSDEIFEEEVESYKTNVLDSSRSVYDKVICDNGSERAFAEDLSEDEQVRVFCKLPQNFYVGTPTGNYRPDWAILYQRKRLDGKIERKLYLVRETKFGYTKIRGTRNSIPPEEQDKIDCALRHFKEIGEIDYTVVFSIDDFKEGLPN